MDAFLCTPFDVTDHVNPGANVDLMPLDRLKQVFNVDIRNLWRVGIREVVLQPQRRFFSDIFIDASLH